MTKKQYLQNLKKSLDAGRISEEAYDQAIINMDNFAFDEDDEESNVDLEDNYGIDDLFCVTLNNMTKQDAKFYCETYGLVYRPNRNNGKGFDLAGDEDSVREMLEDYIGRYDEIGRIMNEGNYIPDYDQDDFIDPNRSILIRTEDSKKVKDSTTWYIIKDEDIRERNVGNVPFFKTSLFGELTSNGFKCKWKAGDLYTTCSPKELKTIKSEVNLINGPKTLAEFYLKPGYKIIKGELKDNKVKDSKDPREVELERIFKKLESEDLTDEQRDYLEEQRDYLRDQLNKSKKVKDSDPWHEVAQYELTFEDGHKETDSIPLYAKMGYSDEELVDYFQDYYEDKIVRVRQIGWYRMGDKKVKDAYSDKYKNIKAIKEAIQAGTNADVLKNIKGIIKSRGGKIIGSRATPERIQIEWELNGANCINTINLRESLFDIDCGRLAEDINRYSNRKVRDSEDVTWRFVLNKRRNYYDEYVVKTYKNGKYYEDATYYTDDWDDAVATLKFEAKRQGLTITVDTPTRVVAE